MYRDSLELSRQLVDRLGRTPEALRDLSVSLDHVGRVAKAQGDWPSAAAAYGESLDLRRQLIDRIGGTPEALRDLSISLGNAGRVAQAQGHWVEAATAYRESLDLRRQLVERLGGTPEALADLAEILLRVAEIPAADPAALAEAASIASGLVARFPEVARYRDLVRQTRAMESVDAQVP